MCSVKDNEPLVSIIIAVFNGESTLSQAIESVLYQSYNNIELLIIDGNSTDNTVEIIKKYSTKLSYWISEKDSGIYNAWNKGLNKAKGEWIGFIGSDDAYYQDAIQNYVNLINESNDSSLHYISSKVNLVNSKGATLKILGEPWNWNEFRQYMNVAHVGSLHARNLFNSYGKYDENYKIVGDYEMLLRAGKNLSAAFLPIITAQMRDGGVSVSTNAIREGIKARINTTDCNPFIVNVKGYLGILKFSILNKVFPNHSK